MRIILGIFMFSQFVLAGDHERESWADSLPTKAEFISIFLLGLCNAQAADNSSGDLNCSSFSYPPFTLTDAQTEGMAYWQIGTGIFACVLIVSNYLAPCLFYKRREKHKVEILEHNINEIDSLIINLKLQENELQDKLEKLKFSLVRPRSMT